MATEKTLHDMVQQATTRTKLEELAAKTLELQTADKFRLAAGLLDQNLVDLAETVAQRAIDEIKLANLLYGKK